MAVVRERFTGYVLAFIVRSGVFSSYLDENLLCELFVLEVLCE